MYGGFALLDHFLLFNLICEQKAKVFARLGSFQYKQHYRLPAVITSLLY